MVLGIEEKSERNKLSIFMKLIFQCMGLDSIKMNYDVILSGDKYYDEKVKQDKGMEIEEKIQFRWKEYIVLEFWISIIF